MRTVRDMETQSRMPGRPFITRFIAGLAIGLGTMGAVFAVASAAASGLKVDFASMESDTHRRNAGFEAAHATSARTTGPTRGSQ